MSEVLLSKEELLHQMEIALRDVMKAIEDLVDDSHGIAGLHLNGDVAPWEELLEGGRFEEWTEPAFSNACNLLKSIDETRAKEEGIQR